MSRLKTQGFSHQEEYLHAHGTDEAYALWWEMGTGKSRAALDTAVALYDAGKIDALLLLAPNGLHRNFITKEVPKHFPDDIKVHTFCWSTEKSKTKTWQRASRAFMASKGFKILGMSFDGLMTEVGRTLTKDFLVANRCLYVVDESARIKNPDSDRTKRVLASARYAKYRRIMTGTPISQAPWDAYAQIKFLDVSFWDRQGLGSLEAMKATFGVWDRVTRRIPVGAAKSMERRAKYGYAGHDVPDCLKIKFQQSPAGGMLVNAGTAFQQIPVLARDANGMPQYRNLQQLRDILAPIRSRVLKHDVFDLPPKLFSILEHELSPAQRAAYEDLRERGFTMLSEHAVTAGMALTLLLRLQQIVCGYLPVDAQGETASFVHRFEKNPRLDLLRELIDGVSHQGIIWARFRSDIDQICDTMTSLGISHARYDGKLSEDECIENETRFHAGDAQWFVSNQAKGGEGLTLIEAQTVIYYSNSFKLTERLQSEDRPHRYGQINPVGYIDLVARDTVDERLITALQAKLDVASAVTGDALRTWLSTTPQAELFT